ncbi:hypothetical protein [Flavobacterium gilvum]|uniref:Lipoprotein n=1 Tax=Flavobacterium gilvum TaxID=1492737 RepID=A0AAC9I5G8_9FLAO|nr:hypothetical protein [Flavobacterium gilvum]AOW08993.1 hypothetical protein EM308_05425 [Flavobacterium gilvum]KFC60533.1 hypothetical protein FEM08_05750 [Flavobacterium gilvum]
MRVLFISILLLTVQSCATKKDIKKLLLPEGIKSATEEIYSVVNNQKMLLQKKEMVFTRNGRIKYSKTVDASGNLVQETKKKLWFVVEKYPNKEPYYCKTRWKPNQRERISCYTQKQYKQNESIYHYNSDGSINKTTDNFSPFCTQYFYYTDKKLSKITIKNKNDTIVDEILITCEANDEKGACLKQTRISTKTNNKQEILLFPSYD